MGDSPGLLLEISRVASGWLRPPGGLPKHWQGMGGESSFRQGVASPIARAPKQRLPGLKSLMLCASLSPSGN